MPTPPLSDEVLRETVDAYNAHNRDRRLASKALGIADRTLYDRLKTASARGLMLSHPPAMPGFRITQRSNITRPIVDRKTGDILGESVTTSIQERLEPGEKFEVLDGLKITGVSALLDEEERILKKWVLTREDKSRTVDIMRATVAAFKEEMPRVDPVVLNPQVQYNADLLNQYTVTDLHFGMLSWREETGADYDLKIAEQLLLDWFAAAIRMSPDASTAILCQLGDLLHHDAHESVTPAHRNVLDADSRLQKMIRVVIRTMRRIVAMLLEKHERVHVIMADANHDPAGGAWLREMFAAFYESEPRVTVENSASTFYVYEFGETSLFYHHGHKRKIASVDSVFAGKFREAYGRTKFSYAHLGHLHSDELKSTPLMKVERHETLAAPDAYSANGGWGNQPLSTRSAKVITYSRRFGYCGTVTLTPEMVMGASSLYETRR